jgi:hypothetical protein
MNKIIETFLIVTIWKPERQKKLVFKFEDRPYIKNDWYWVMADDFVSDYKVQGFRVIAVEVWLQSDGLVQIVQK